MIHWGSDVPGQTSRGATPPSGYCSEDELAIIKPVSEKRVWASNPRLTSSLSQLNLSENMFSDSGCKTSCCDERDFGSNSSSQSNLVATMWLNRKQLLRNTLQKDYSPEKPEPDATKLIASRCRSRSLEDISAEVSRGLCAPEVILDIDAPPSVNENQDLAVYMSIINRSSNQSTLTASFRLDAGLRKIKTKTQKILLEAKKTAQLSLLLPASELWQGLKRSERHFTVLATTHNHDDGTVQSKIDHVTIHWRKLSLTRTTKSILAKAPLFIGGY